MRGSSSLAKLVHGLVGTAVAALLLVAGASGSPRTEQDRRSTLQRQMDALVAAGVPGVVVLVHGKNGTLRLASGHSNLARKTPMRVTDRFRVGSITKSFVATVVLQLVGEGKLSLDDTVEHWLPGAVPNGDKITLRNLLSHRSGLYDYLSDPRVLKPYLSGNFGYSWTPRRLVAVSASHKPLFAPGTTTSYSNTNYILLGLIVEKATGNSIGAELKRRIFAPLQLRSTSLGHLAAHAAPVRARLPRPGEAAPGRDRGQPLLRLDGRRDRVDGRRPGPVLSGLLGGRLLGPSSCARWRRPKTTTASGSHARGCRSPGGVAAPAGATTERSPPTTRPP